MKLSSLAIGLPLCFALARLTALDGIEGSNPSPAPLAESLSTTAAEADYQSGKRLMLGEGVESDLVRGATLLQKAAESGHPEAQGYYGFLLARGTGLPKDESAAISWLKKAAAAEVASAQLNLGLMLMKGLGGERDMDEAIHCITKAAEQNHITACARLAEAWYFGEEGLEKNTDKALPWAIKAAEGGNAWAQNLYGNMLEWGISVPLDREAALLWYRRSAEQGNAKAQASLGRLLAGALVGERDVVEAYMWLWKSMEQGEANATNFLKDLVKGMSETERKAALERIGLDQEP